MYYLCPKTHFEHSIDARTEFVMSASRRMRAKVVSSRDSRLEIDEDEFRFDVVPEILAEARAIYRQMPGRYHELTNDQVMSLISPELSESLMGRLRLEYICTGDLNNFGRSTYLVSRELTTLLATTELHVDVSVLRLPRACVQLVFDNQLMRDAVLANRGDAGPDEGIVCVYAMEDRFNGERVLAIYAYLMSNAIVLGHAQQNLMLKTGSSIAAAISEATSQGTPNPNVQMRFSRALLPTIVANTLLYMCSNNRSVSPGLQFPPVGVSAREVYRALRSITRLEYWFVGGWLPTPSSEASRWSVNGDCLSHVRV